MHARLRIFTVSGAPVGGGRCTSVSFRAGVMGLITDLAGHKARASR